jgi:hypothetical protein
VLKAAGEFDRLSSRLRRLQHEPSVEVLMSENWLFLIPIASLVLFVVGAIGVVRLQKRVLRTQGEMGSGPVLRTAVSTGFDQSPDESREEFVRRHWQRPGVVANGVTLVDLYDRIRALEERLARAEGRSAVPPTD